MTRRGFTGADHQARYNVGALEQRVYGLEQSISGISQQIAGLAQKIDARAQTNWPVIIGFGGFALSIMVAIGGMAYWPIREAQSDLKAIAAKQTDVIGSLGDRFVSIRELEGRSGRTQSELARLNADIGSQELNMRRSIEQADGNLQRQLDDMKKAFGDTFSLRDALLQMQRRIDQLEAARRSS